MIVSRDRPRSPRVALFFALSSCAALLVSGTACRLDTTDRPCHEDAQCGSGFDCYRGVCHPVCNVAADCASGRTCTRHRCVTVEGAALSGPAAPTAPPPPDATVAELRALRREVEMIRRDLDRLLAAQGLKPAVPDRPPGLTPSAGTTTPGRSPGVILLPSPRPSP